MKKVVAFQSKWHWRISIQLEADDVGKTYAAYAGVLEAGESHSTYEPQESGGRGEFLPDARKEKISVAEACAIFSYTTNMLDREGYRYRD